MATDKFVSNPVVNSESTSSTYWDWNPDPLLHLTPGQRDRARYLGQSWQIESTWDSTSMDAPPIGLLNTCYRSSRDAHANAHVSQQAPLPKLSSVSEESSRSYNPDSSPLPPITPLDRTHAMPSRPANVQKRRCQPAHPLQRKSHNEIEARYRETVKTAFQTLQQVVPPPIKADGTAIDERKRPNFTKATVIIGAAAYIKHLETKYCQLVKENDALRKMKAMPGPMPETWF